MVLGIMMRDDVVPIAMTEIAAMMLHNIYMSSVPPGPIVTFAERAKRMTEVLYAIRKSPDAKAATPTIFVKHGSRKKERSQRGKQPRRSKRTPTLFDNEPSE